MNYKPPILLLIFMMAFGFFFTEAKDVAFVSRQGHQFIRNNKPYYFIGVNYWYGGMLAIGSDSIRGKERVKKELDFLRSQGVNNLRVLAGSEGRGLVNGVDRLKPSLQPEQGKFQPDILRGLDYLLSEMAKRDMVAVLYLSNNWEWSGGFLQYLNWNKKISDSTMQSKMSWDGLRDNTSMFYSCKPCKEDYLKQVDLIMNHVNSYTGRPYIQDPAIMAWQLANEPRPMRTSAVEEYKKWTSSVASYIKSKDKNHLVTIGTEGIMGTDESAELFRDVHAPSQIDYLTVHIWPKNWQWFKGTNVNGQVKEVIRRSDEYITRHVDIARDLKKPMVIEEFGLPRDEHSFSPSGTTTARDEYFETVFSSLRKSYQAGDVIAGCNIWSFGGMARPMKGQLFWKEGDDFMGDPPQEEQGLNSLFDSDASTWTLIKSFTDTLSQKQ